MIWTSSKSRNSVSEMPAAPWFAPRRPGTNVLDSGGVAFQENSATLTPSFRIVEDRIAQFDLVVFAAQRIMRAYDLTYPFATAFDEAQSDPLV
jgi:hypothetical protein